MNVLIHNARIVKPGAGISNGSVLVRDGHIVAVGEVDTATSDEVPVVDGGGRLLTPGLIDLHTHGVDTALYERSEEDYFAAARVLPKFGNTCVLPTLYRVMNRPSLKLLERFADTLPKVKEVSMPGFHLEGPFLALPGAGADTIPGDVVLLEELIAACRGRVLAMSISPDTKNIIPVIERLVAHKITPLMTHTAATAEQTQAAIDAGASHATHFYDVFPAPEVTEPGVRPVGTVEAILADPRVTVDFVCDGVHASPFAIRAALAAKGWQGVVLITDSNIGAGLLPGVYDTPWGFKVRVRDGDGARHDEKNTLAGSALTMDRGIVNLFNWLKIPPEQVWAMGTLNPARVLGLERKGRIAPGADADLVLWNEDLTAAHTWVNGISVYEKSAG
jgi:N-acetylglucosamine-6-phosphate deacetylase|uniref:N-acetylglucosamine-6-phosphate deacetylase n=1 Tax=Cephaloticoccus sp. TaxID=1985742 RepID=UPI00404AA56D